MNNKVAAIRQLLADAQKRPNKEENNIPVEIGTQIAAHDFVLDQSPKARDLREIFRLANLYGWQYEIEKAMDDAQVILITHMPDEKIGALKTRLHHLKDCIDCGASSPDAPPAC